MNGKYMKLYDYLDKNEYIKDDEREAVLYGVRMFCIISVSIIVCVGIALFMKMIWECALFLAALIPLRQNAGGYHMNSRIACAVMSSFVLCQVLLIVKYVYIKEDIQIFMELASALVIMILSPVDNENNRMNDREKKFLYNKTRKILLSDMMVFVVLYAVRFYYWSNIVMLATVITSILVLTGHMVNYLQMKGNVREIQGRNM